MRNHDWLNCDIEYIGELIPFAIFNLYNSSLKTIQPHEWQSIHCWMTSFLESNIDWKATQNDTESKSFKIINKIQKSFEFEVDFGCQIIANSSIWPKYIKSVIGLFIYLVCAQKSLRCFSHPNKTLAAFAIVGQNLSNIMIVFILIFNQTICTLVHKHLKCWNGFYL